MRSGIFSSAGSTKGRLKQSLSTISLLPQQPERTSTVLAATRTAVNCITDIDRECVTTVDTSKVDEALEVTDLSESDLYEIDGSQYVRKADVDQEVKESRHQGLKDQLAAESPETDELHQEIEELEARIDEPTSITSTSETD